MERQKEIQMKEFKIQRLNAKLMFERTDLKLHPQQVPTLLCVLGKEGRTQSEVACEQNISPAAIGVSVRRLEKSGFLRVETDDRDLRVRRLYVTDEGKEALEQARLAYEQVAEAKLSGFSQQEMEQYISFLNRIYDNLKQYSQKGYKE